MRQARVLDKQTVSKASSFHAFKFQVPGASLEPTDQMGPEKAKETVSRRRLLRSLSPFWAMGETAALFSIVTKDGILGLGLRPCAN